MTISTAAQAQTYVEIGDAGSSAAAAQNTNNRALTSITGTLTSPADADFYVIYITTPGAFSASTVGGSTLDTQIYLFTANGSPVYLNDDAAGGTSLQSLLSAGNALGPLTAGTYILGISQSGVDAVNAASQQLFANPFFSTDTVGPNGLNPGPVTGVINNSGATDIGAYGIALTGVTGVPEPGTISLLAIAGAAGAAAIRRRATRQS